jgi:hypothetical protein
MLVELESATKLALFSAEGLPFGIPLPKLKRLIW